VTIARMVVAICRRDACFNSPFDWLELHSNHPLRLVAVQPAEYYFEHLIPLAVASNVVPRFSDVVKEVT
jgi:hypothetical protein